MKVHVVMSAFAPASQVARALERFENTHKDASLVDYTVYVVNGHYPLNYDENQAALKELPALFNPKGRYTLLDPGRDLGSAQTQNWAIKKIQPGPKDYIVNLDPDAACDTDCWLDKMLKVMELEPKLAMLHLLNPVVWENIVKLRKLPVEWKHIEGLTLAIPLKEEQFNMTMFRASFLGFTGGILQEHKWYGQVELPMYFGARRMGFYSAYLWSVMEAYDLKLLEDKEFEMWKMAHAHDKSFMGTFAEYCRHIGATDGSKR